jgi:hypothetical protein
MYAHPPIPTPPVPPGGLLWLLDNPRAAAAMASPGKVPYVPVCDQHKPHTRRLAKSELLRMLVSIVASCTGS